MSQQNFLKFNNKPFLILATIIFSRYSFADKPHFVPIRSSNEISHDAQFREAAGPIDPVHPIAKRAMVLVTFDDTISKDSRAVLLENISALKEGGLPYGEYILLLAKVEQNLKGARGSTAKVVKEFLKAVKKREKPKYVGSI